jgi:protease PrsW
MIFLILLALSFAPGLAIGLYIYLKDKHEREPVHLLVISFFYGGISTVITIVISRGLQLTQSVKPDALEQFYNAFFKVALVEEFSKFIFVRFVLYYNKNFNEPFDGIVYAIMIGMGFATVENFFYVFEQGVMVGILRIFTAVPAHATLAVIMGFFLGKAKFLHNRQVYYSSLALIVSTIFHGLYDYFLFIAYIPGLWVGALMSLTIGFFLSRKAISIHQQASPFLKQKL